MERDALTFGTIVVGVALGTATLLFGESSGNEPLLLAGGALVILSVGGLTGAIARA
jgi:hypothetical protein